MRRWALLIAVFAGSSIADPAILPSAPAKAAEPTPAPQPAPVVIAALDLAKQPTTDELEPEQLQAEVPAGDRQIFPEPYTTLEGVVTFRGGPKRTGGAYGVIPANPTKLKIVWQLQTEHGLAPWFGGAGWTGQPVIVKWPDVIRHSMPRLGKRRFQNGLVEVIQGSLDGNVYFVDLFSGKQTRPPLRTGNPIKGSVSLDPRGYPILFVGQGIPEKAPIGLRIYELIHNRQVFFLPGHDADAPRSWWGAFDSSGLVNRKTDTYVVGGENGLVYQLALNTAFDPIALTLKVEPTVARYRYRTGPLAFGVESSLTAVKNLAFFADNGGTIQAVDLRTFQPLWAFQAGDDTDASLTVEWEGEQPALYTGCEVDKSGKKGLTHLRRLDALTGKLVWDRPYRCEGLVEPRRREAGVFATNVIGQGDVADLVFFTLSRCPGPQDGTVVALDKATGEEVWRFSLPKFSWSSPTALTDAKGKTWLLQAGIGGVVRLLDARTGAEAAQVQLIGDIEASPAVFGDRAVLGTRADRIYGLQILGE